MYIASRSESKVENARQAIVAECPDADVHFLPLDLADLGSVVEAARTFKEYGFFLSIDVWRSSTYTNI